MTGIYRDLLLIRGSYPIIKSILSFNRQITEHAMKLKIVSMLIILAFLSVMPMIYMGKFDPSALMSANDELDFDLGEIVARVFKKDSGVIVDNKVQVYKWRDKEGVMQFSSEPPSGTYDTEQIVLHPDSNVLQAVKVREKETIQPVAKIEKSAVTPYSINGMKKVVDDAKGIEEMLQQREEQQQKTLNDI